MLSCLVRPLADGVSDTGTANLYMASSSAQSRIMLYRLFVDHAGDVFYPKNMVASGPAAKHKGQSKHLTLIGIRFTDEALRAWTDSVDRLLARVFPDLDPACIEIHTGRMLGKWREPPWDRLPDEAIPGLFSEIRDILLRSGAAAYGHVFDKVGYWKHFRTIVPEDPGPNAIRWLLRRVDQHLQGTPNMFQVTFDEDSTAVKQAFHKAILHVKENGDSLDPSTPSVSNLKHLTSYGWSDSRTERGLQAADFVAYWTQKAAEHGKANRIRQMDSIWRRPFTGSALREPYVFPDGPALAALKGTHVPQ